MPQPRTASPQQLFSKAFLAAMFIALVSPLSGKAQTLLVTSDSSLNTGNAVTANYTAPGSSSPVSNVTAKSNAAVLWLLDPDPWGVNTGSGTISMNYSGSGSMVTTVNLSGLPGGGVDGSPFMLYGCDEWSDCFLGQPPQFPKQLSSMSSLVVDVQYALGGTITGGDVDVLFDEWVCTSNHPTDSTQCLEVEVLPYFSFVDGSGGTFIKTLNEPVTLNGSASTLSFDEQVWGQDVLFYPHAGAVGNSAAEIRFNILDFLNSAVTAYGNSNYSWLAGVELGTEFGASPTQNYTLTVSKLDIEQTLAGAPAPPTNLKAVVQ